ncbi:hypothetical protein ACQ4PT_005265 [Festuca glaucescens]
MDQRDIPCQMEKRTPALPDVAVAVALDSVQRVGPARMTIQASPCHRPVKEIGRDYPTLIEGGHKNLGSVVIGKKAAQEALAILASYSSATPEAEIKKALTTFVLMLCEATRFFPVRKAVKEAWETGGMFPKVGVELVVVWRETSCALLVWSRQQGKGWSQIKEVEAFKLQKKGDPLMETGDNAINNVCLLLRPVAVCSDGKTVADD